MSIVQIPDSSKFLMKVLWYGNDPEVVDNIMRRYNLRPTITHIRRLVMKARTTCLGVVLDHIREFGSKHDLTSMFPDIIIQLVRAELIHGKSKEPPFFFIRRLLNEFQIDVNHNDFRQGTLFHVLCSFPSKQNDVISFVSSIIQLYPNADLEATCRKRRRGRGQFFQSTPLQFAIEKGCYEYAIFLIKQGARTDKLVFDKYSIRHDLKSSEKESYIKLMNLLVSIGSLDCKQVLDTVKLSRQHRQLLLNSVINRSLLKLCVNSIRRLHPTREEQEYFLEVMEKDMAIDPQIRQMLLLSNI